MHYEDFSGLLLAAFWRIAVIAVIADIARHRKIRLRRLRSRDRQL